MGAEGAKVQRSMVVPGWHGQAPLLRADAEFIVENEKSPDRKGVKK